MKKIFFLLVPLTLCLQLTVHTQDAAKFIGTWEGKLNVGVELRIVFHIKNDEQGLLKATADSPDQAVYGFKCDEVTMQNDSIHIFIKTLNASFAGKKMNDSSIIGVFTQERSIPLSLTKVDNPIEMRRPQLPVPPFPYKVEEVEYNNSDNSLHYGATLTIPAGTGPFPAAVLITGSGPQDRDESIGGHSPFAVLADALTKNGFITLRVDDRGVGKSTGIFKDASSEDFAKDVNTSFDYLLKRPEVDKRKAGLIGHSEGGMIAPMVAAERKDVYFIVLLAAPGVKINQLMAEQNAAILKSVGIDQRAIDAYLPFYKSLMNLAATSKDTVSSINSAVLSMERWANATDTSILNEMGFESAQARIEIAKNLIREFSGPWFRYFLRFDPSVYLKKVRSRVLALNGDKDLQVIASSNLGGIEASLKNGRAKKYTLKTMPGLNHLFQTCIQCTLQEYPLLEETFAQAALKEINDWLNKFIK